MNRSRLKTTTKQDSRWYKVPKTFLTFKDLEISCRTSRGPVPFDGIVFSFLITTSRRDPTTCIFSIRDKKLLIVLDLCMPSLATVVKRRF